LLLGTTQSTCAACISKDAVASLVASTMLNPADTASIPEQMSARAMFMFLRSVALLHQLPVAVASPLLALQKIFGKNAVPDVGLKLHKPAADAQYFLIPFPVAVAPHDIMADCTSDNVHWVPESNESFVIVLS
jgi:hypothetical protein